MRVLGKTGLFGADRRGLGRALAVRGVRGGAANRAKTGGEQFYISVKTAKSCRIALFSMVSGVLRVRRGRFSILQKTDLQLNQNSAKKSSGSTLGFSVLGGAAFCVVALAEICPEYRLFFPGADPAVLVVNQVKNFLLSIHRQ